MTGHILIVDDSGFARRTLRQMLETGGHSVDEAANGSDALERYFLKKPDLVLLDLVMEGITGMDVLARLRELDPSARVVVASADVQSSTRAEAQSGGAIGFINKPFVREDVLNAVSHVLAGGMAWS
ncbi:MAG TPA: response regulator [Candidatus Binatia bacterium]|nr:response regulator [Candidatus Binatia bacterium]